MLSFSFLPWKWGIPVEVWIGFFAILMGFLGIVISVYPPASKRAKSAYLTAFGLCSVLIIALTWVQSASNKRDQYETAEKNSNQVYSVQRSFDDYKKANERPVPAIPHVSIESMVGLPSHLKSNPHLRYHRLAIRNKSNVQLDNWCSRLQLPEPITTVLETNHPPGATINFHPIMTEYSVVGTGSRSVIGPSSSVHPVYASRCMMPQGHSAHLAGFSKDGESTGVWELTMDKVPALGEVSILFLTSNDGEATNYIAHASTPFETNGANIRITHHTREDGSFVVDNMTTALIVGTDDQPRPDWRFGTNELRYSFEGIFQYPAAGQPGSKRFLVPIMVNNKTREIVSLPPREDDGDWRRVVVEFQ